MTWKTVKNEREYYTVGILNTELGKATGELVPRKRVNKKWVFHRERKIKAEFYRREIRKYFFRINSNTYQLKVDDPKSINILNSVPMGVYWMNIVPTRVYASDPKPPKSTFKDEVYRKQLNKLYSEAVKTKNTDTDGEDY